MLALVWGCNWPVLKLGVTEIAPLTFRALTLPFAALGLLGLAKLSGESIRVPRAALGKSVRARVAPTSPAGTGCCSSGVQQLPAGRSAILAFTMPIWSVLFSLALLHEPLSPRKIVGMVSRHAGNGAAARRRHPTHPAHADRRAARARRFRRRGHSAPCCCANGSRRCRRTRSPAG